MAQMILRITVLVLNDSGMDVISLASSDKLRCLCWVTEIDLKTRIVLMHFPNYG